MVSAIRVCWHSLDHPVAELGEELEVRLFHLGQCLNCLRLFFGLVERFKDLGLGCKICDDIICITTELNFLIGIIKLIELVLDLFTPV